MNSAKFVAKLLFCILLIGWAAIVLWITRKDMTDYYQENLNNSL